VLTTKRPGQASFDIFAGSEKLANGTVAYEPLAAGTR